MKRKTLSVLLVIALVLSLHMVIATPTSAANPTTIASSTMVFEGELTDNEDGTFSGVVYAIEGGGFDIYAEEGSEAWFGNDPGSGPVWTTQSIVDHDAWPTWPIDTPDWYQYSLKLYYDTELSVQKWALRNHAGSTEGDPHSTDPAGMPMSGVMDWSRMYAAELDFGHYLPDTGEPQIVDGAAGYGGGLWHWDMDWTWGSESVPLQYVGFSVDIESLDGDQYRVTLTPDPSPVTEVWVDDNWAGTPYGTEVEEGKFFGYNAFAEIQKAIKAVSHTTVYVYEGTYDENIVINGVDVDLIAVGDVTIDGATDSYSNKTIAIYNSTCAIDGFTVKHNGCAIYARGMSSYGDGEVNVTIINNYITDYIKNGITVNGDLASGLVKDNTVESDADSVYAQNGIQFGYGATGQVLRNTVDTDWYEGEDWTASGILIFESDGVSVKKNTVTNAQTGIAIETWGWYCSSASYNQVANNIIDHSDWGITVTAVSWDGYSTMDAFASNNKIVNNVVTDTTADGEIGIYVGALDYSDSYTPEADNNKAIRNDVSGFEESIVEEGTATKVHANKFPVP